MSLITARSLQDAIKTYISCLKEKPDEYKQFNWIRNRTGNIYVLYVLEPKPTSKTLISLEQYQDN